MNPIPPWNKTCSDALNNCVDALDNSNLRCTHKITIEGNKLALAYAKHALDVLQFPHLSETLFTIFGRTGDGRWVAVPMYTAENEFCVKRLVLHRARMEGYRGTADERIAELGWEIRPLFANVDPHELAAKLVEQDLPKRKKPAVKIVIKMVDGYWYAFATGPKKQRNLELVQAIRFCNLRNLHNLRKKP